MKMPKSILAGGSRNEKEDIGGAVSGGQNANG
jgi:hypothetical protein